MFNFLQSCDIESTTIYIITWMSLLLPLLLGWEKNRERERDKYRLLVFLFLVMSNLDSRSFELITFVFPLTFCAPHSLSLFLLSVFSSFCLSLCFSSSLVLTSFLPLMWGWLLSYICWNNWRPFFNVIFFFFFHSFCRVSFSLHSRTSGRPCGSRGTRTRNAGAGWTTTEWGAQS